jgi:hypothetical protein
MPKVTFSPFTDHSGCTPNWLVLRPDSRYSTADSENPPTIFKLPITGQYFEGLSISKSLYLALHDENIFWHGPRCTQTAGCQTTGASRYNQVPRNWPCSPFSSNPPFVFIIRCRDNLNQVAGHELKSPLTCVAVLHSHKVA